MIKSGLSRKFIHYLIPMAALLIFVLIMQGAIYSYGPQDDRHALFSSQKILSKDIQKTDWEAAAEESDNLQRVWNRLIPRLQFHAEMDAIDDIELSLGRLDGFITARDKGGALAELGEINEHLNNLTN